MTKHSLGRDVIVVITVKLVIVVTAAIFVFGPRQRPQLDTGSIETRLIGTDVRSLHARSPEP